MMRALMVTCNMQVIEFGGVAQFNEEDNSHYFYLKRNNNVQWLLNPNSSIVKGVNGLTDPSPLIKKVGCFQAIFKNCFKLPSFLLKRGETAMSRGHT